jgi:hypothetical protein
MRCDQRPDKSTKTRTAMAAKNIQFEVDARDRLKRGVDHWPTP